MTVLAKPLPLRTVRHQRWEWRTNETVGISTLGQCKFGMVRWLTLLIATWLMDADMVVDERVALPDISNSVGTQLPYKVIIKFNVTRPITEAAGTINECQATCTTTRSRCQYKNTRESQKGRGGSSVSKCLTSMQMTSLSTTRQLSLLPPPQMAAATIDKRKISHLQHPCLNL
jgi:hypothetical protein